MSGTSVHCKLVKKTHFVRYSNNIHTVLYYYYSNEKINHYVLANLLSKNWVLLAIESGLSRHTVLAIPHRLIRLCFGI